MTLSLSLSLSLSPSLCLLFQLFFKMEEFICKASFFLHSNFQLFTKFIYCKLEKRIFLIKKVRETGKGREVFLGWVLGEI